MDDAQRIATTGQLAADFVEAARVGGADCAIPSCPAWTMRQLVDHVALEYAAWYYSNLTLAPDHPDPIKAARDAQPPTPEPSAPFGLTATDAGTSWFMYEEGGRAHYECGGAEKASARAAAPAESLYLWLAGRQTPSEVAVIGDPAIAQAWRPDWS